MNELIVHLFLRRVMNKQNRRISSMEDLLEECEELDEAEWKPFLGNQCSQQMEIINDTGIGRV